MTYLPATCEYGIVIRKNALDEKGITEEKLMELLNDVDILAQNESLISVGPLFGELALEGVRTRLVNAGLDYVDDFAELDYLIPEWLKIGVSLA